MAGTWPSSLDEGLFFGRAGAIGGPSCAAGSGSVSIALPMKPRRLHPLLLAFALLLTQWLSFAHALEHPALAQDKACAVCAIGINLDGGAPLPASPAVAAAPAHEAPLAVAAVTLVTAPRALPRARGPPQLLA